MTSRRRRLAEHLQLVITPPRVEVKHRSPAAETALPGSREGHTGTPRRTVRIDDATWGGFLAAIAAVNRRDPGRELDASKLIRGWIDEFTAGRLTPEGTRPAPEGRPPALS